MGLTYHFRFEAPAATFSSELLAFLRKVEQKAKSLGFGRTLVVASAFQTEEQRQFSTRLTTGFRVEDNRLKSCKLAPNPFVRRHSATEGYISLMPTEGVFLLASDPKGELVLGFFKFPERVEDVNGRVVAEAGLNGKWSFQDFLKTPEPTIRILVQEFAAAGFLVKENDDFKSS